MYNWQWVYFLGAVVLRGDKKGNDGRRWRRGQSINQVMIYIN